MKKSTIVIIIILLLIIIAEGAILIFTRPGVSTPPENTGTPPTDGPESTDTLTETDAPAPQTELGKGEHDEGRDPSAADVPTVNDDEKPENEPTKDTPPYAPPQEPHPTPVPEPSSAPKSEEVSNGVEVGVANGDGELSEDEDP